VVERASKEKNATNNKIAAVNNGARLRNILEAQRVYHLES
jgi:hypothetical protein